MAKIIDISGKRYGRLTVLSLNACIKREKGKSYTTWNAECDCGRVKIIRKSNLISGTTTCGCAQEAARAKPRTDLATLVLSRAFSSYKKRAEKNSIDFSLNKETFEIIIQSPCDFCGKEPEISPVRRKNKTEGYAVNTVDRIDSNEGYKLGNVIPACRAHNKMKNNMDILEFYKHAVSAADRKEIYASHSQ